MVSPPLKHESTVNEMNKNNDLSVAVVIPYFRKMPFVYAAVKSALNQSTTPVEIIVVDDGSEDNVAEVISSIDSRVQLITQTNAGPSVARNRGWQASHASHILFLDADDLLLPRSIETLLAATQSDNDAVAVMGFERFYETPGDFNESRRVPPVNFVPMPSLLMENVTAIHGVLIPRVALTDTSGFDENMKHCEDWDLWVRVAVKGYKFIPVDYTGAYYRTTSQSLSSDHQNMIKGHTRILEKLARQATVEPNSDRIPMRILANELRVRLHKSWRNARPRTEWLDIHDLLAQMEVVERDSPNSFSSKAFNLLPFRIKERLRYLIFCRHDEICDELAR